jgi:hypothetical protein
MKEEGRDEHEIKKMGEVLQVDLYNFLRIKYVGLSFGRSQCFGSSSYLTSVQIKASPP